MPKASPSAPLASPSTVGGAIGVASGRCGERQRAGQREIVEIVAGGLRQRPVLSPAGHAAVDEPRIALGAVGRPEAEPLHHAGPVALDQRVGGSISAIASSTPPGCLRSIVDDALSAPQRVLRRRRGRDCRACALFGRTIGDDLGAVVGEHAAGERTRADALEFDRS